MSSRGTFSCFQFKAGFDTFALPLSNVMRVKKNAPGSVHICNLLGISRPNKYLMQMRGSAESRALCMQETEGDTSVSVYLEVDMPVAVSSYPIESVVRGSAHEAGPFMKAVIVTNDELLFLLNGDKIVEDILTIKKEMFARFNFGQSETP